MEDGSLSGHDGLGDGPQARAFRFAQRPAVEAAILFRRITIPGLVHSLGFVWPAEHIDARTGLHK